MTVSGQKWLASFMRSTMNVKTITRPIFRFNVMLLAAAVSFVVFCAPPAVQAQSNGLTLPKLSDTILSPRFPRAETIGMINQIRPSRIEWHYLSDDRHFTSLKQALPSGHFSAAINANPPLSGNEGWAQDFDGKPLIAPWMVSWGAKWASVASPVTRAFILNQVDQLLAKNVDGIQIDDGLFQFSAEAWGGGDFSPDSLRGFGPWLAANIPAATLQTFDIQAGPSFDFKAYLTQKHGIRTAADYMRLRNLPVLGLWRQYLMANVMDFNRQVRAKLAAHPRRPLLSANLGYLRPMDSTVAQASVVDFSMSELPIDSKPSHFGVWGATAQALNIPFVGAFAGTTSVARFRHMIALAYAHNINPIFPWDVFVPTTGTNPVPRYFGRTQDFIDLYDFARNNAALLDHRQPGATVGLVVATEHYDEAALYRLADLLAAHNTPYRIILTGGVYSPRPLPTAADVAGLRRLVMVTGPQTYAPDVITRLQQLKVPMIPANQMTAGIASSLGLGSIGSLSAWSLKVMHRLGAPTQHVIHIVPNVYETGSLIGSVTLRQNTSFGFENVSRYILHRPGQAPMTIDARLNGRTSVSITLPQIRDWAILVPDQTTLRATKPGR
jgi:hypothetical protein